MKKNNIQTKAALFTDNSLTKASMEIIRKEVKIRGLRKNWKIASDRSNFLKTKIEKINTRSRAFETLNLKIHQDMKISNQMESAAIKIQRAVRIWLYKDYTPDKHIPELESSLSSNLKYLTQLCHYSFWNLGNAIEEAAIKIQRAFRRCCIRCKFRVIIKTFQIITKNKKKAAKKNLKEGLKVLWNKILKIKQKKIKSKILRGHALEKIRKKIAIIAISKYWRTQIHSWSRFKTKIQRFKINKIKSQLVRTNSKGHSRYSSLVSTPHNDFDIENRQLSMSFAKFAEDKIMKNQQRRLKTSLISYGVEKFKFKLIDPVRQDHDLLSMPSKSTRTVIARIGSDYSKPMTPKSASFRRAFLLSARRK